ncbi:MAG: DUF4382 domain-containing protein [Bacteroidia bacterium]
MNRLTIIVLAAITGLVLILFSCSKDRQSTATLIVELKDAPAAYEEVNVQVTGVEVHSDVTGWITFAVADSIYDLLLLQDSANAALDSAIFPVGKISQVRLILGANNTVKIGGTIYPLSLSSQDETGLKLNLHQDLLAGQVYKLVLDFDAAKSVVEQGNSTYKLKPVLSAELI